LKKPSNSALGLKLDAQGHVLEVNDSQLHQLE
jgi:hypothetical protein